MNKALFVSGGLLIAIVIAVFGVRAYVNSAVRDLGVMGTRFPNGVSIGTTAATQGKLTIGNSGTAIGSIIYGTCTLVADFSIAATSTGMVDCQSSSFASGDTVIIGGLATSSTAMSRQYSLLGTGSASSTAGYAPVRVTNLTGTAAVPSATNGFGSSTPFVIIRP